MNSLPMKILPEKKKPFSLDDEDNDHHYYNDIMVIFIMKSLV